MKALLEFCERNSLIIGMFGYRRQIVKGDESWLGREECKVCNRLYVSRERVKKKVDCRKSVNWEVVGNHRVLMVKPSVGGWSYSY